MTIYAVRDPATRAVKIGYTARRHPGRRISSLQMSSPRKFKLEWFGPGERQDEAGLHALLAPCRAKGEWFDACDLLTLALIVLPVIGARGLIELGRDGLLTFVPIPESPFERNRRRTRTVREQPRVNMPAWYNLRPYSAADPYWPKWSISPEQRA